MDNLWTHDRRTQSLYRAYYILLLDNCCWRDKTRNFMLRQETSNTVLNVPEKELHEREKDIVEFSKQIMYSRRYYDDEYEYR